MKTLTDQLANYAAYHRDRRNIATHFVGIPMIVLAVTILLARPALDLAGLPVSVATVAALAAAIYWLTLDRRYGLVMAVLLAGCLAVAQALAAGPLATWAAAGIGLFVVGWIFQFVGHFWEGRKPAFVDDLTGLVIGPLFVVAEAGFLLGLRPELQAAIEARAQPAP
jgi:uncharacterized membrane protein YGL010W